MLRDVAMLAFDCEVQLLPADVAKYAEPIEGVTTVAVFGKNWAKELRLPNRKKAGGFYVDWILARLDGAGELEEFVAVEVQSIDTTGNYRDERAAYLNGEEFLGHSTAGLNWENVNKRILPQLIYKGHVLRRENLCRKGLFFVCPEEVFNKIFERLGSSLLDYSMQSGSITIVRYELGAEMPEGQIRKLQYVGYLTTTVDQIVNAFASPSNLPARGVYESAIREGL